MNNETFLAYMNAADTLNQFVSRMSLLSALSANSALRSSLEGGFISLKVGGQAFSDQMAQPSSTHSVEAAVDLLKDANERALIGWTNQVQNAILIQDEAAVWARSMGERLEAIGQAALTDVSR